MDFPRVKRFNCPMTTAERFSVLLATCCALSSIASAQSVQVDVTPSHVVNRFSPLYALGSTVDRVPSNATDVFFRPDQIAQIQQAGWGVISYRQNTDLFVQAWHWNPKGKWSDPSSQGYFVGDPTPTREMIRHSYGYSLPHRGFTRNGGTEIDPFSRLGLGPLHTFWENNSLLPTQFHRQCQLWQPQTVEGSLQKTGPRETTRVH